MPARVVLDRATVAEALGPDIDDPHAVACLRFDIAEAVAAVERGLATGILPARQVVRGVPLADWLAPAEVARLLSGAR